MRSHIGLGLGLGITRHFVELHGGAIYAFSDGPETGATFCVHVPAESDSATPAGPASRISAGGYSGR